MVIFQDMSPSADHFFAAEHFASLLLTFAAKYFDFGAKGF